MPLIKTIRSWSIPNGHSRRVAVTAHLDKRRINGSYGSQTDYKALLLIVQFMGDF